MKPLSSHLPRFYLAGFSTNHVNAWLPGVIGPVPRPLLIRVIIKLIDILHQPTRNVKKFHKKMGIHNGRPKSDSSIKWSERQDLNLRPPRPKRGALPN